MKKNNPQKARCHNCVFASAYFRIGSNTHHQCLHPKHEQGLISGELTPWDTLQNWYSTCETHEIKTQKMEVINEK